MSNPALASIHAHVEEANFLAEFGIHDKALKQIDFAAERLSNELDIPLHEAYFVIQEDYEQI